MQIRFRRVVRGKGKLVGSQDKFRSKNFLKMKKKSLFKAQKHTA